jgi:hypothetical protein
MSERNQHGRKPQKKWHKQGAAKRTAQALAKWPTIEGVAYDGTPQPVPQGHGRRRRMGGSWS